MSKRDRPIIAWMDKLKVLIEQNAQGKLGGLATYQLARYNVEQELIKAIVGDENLQYLEAHP